MTCFFYPYRSYDSGFAPSALSLRLNDKPIHAPPWNERNDAIMNNISQSDKKLRAKTFSGQGTRTLEPKPVSFRTVLDLRDWLLGFCGPAFWCPRADSRPKQRKTTCCPACYFCSLWYPAISSSYLTKRSQLFDCAVANLTVSYQDDFGPVTGNCKWH